MLDGARISYTVTQLKPFYQSLISGVNPCDRDMSKRKYQGDRYSVSPSSINICEDYLHTGLGMPSNPKHTLELKNSLLGSIAWGNRRKSKSRRAD